MKLSINNSTHLLSSKPICSASALFIAIFIWHITTERRIYTKTVSIPVTFFHTEELGEKQSIEAPETIHVMISGNRTALTSLDTDSLAAHIDARTLGKKPSVLKLSRRHLFLPPSVELVSYTPVTVHLT